MAVLSHIHHPYIVQVRVRVSCVFLRVYVCVCLCVPGTAVMNIAVLLSVQHPLCVFPPFYKAP